ncbi:MAG: glycosyltransferase family 39 protein [Methanobacterium paludis]|nr:glycosyltransferase family 39 protein [Methanobacterium paludis]
MLNPFNYFKSKTIFKQNLLIPLILGLLVIITRVPFMSKALYEWDSVNYAMAFEKYNILQQQPHPPGYILYVALGKAVNYIFNDPNTSMIVLSITFSIFTVVLVYFMAREIFSKNVAITAAILMIFNPLIWFYGEIASIYIFEAFFGVLIAYSSYKLLKGNEKFIYISAFVLGLAGGFRIDIVEFMFPLWIFCVWYARPSYAKIIKGLFVFIMSISLWLVPTILLTGGYKEYFALLKTTSEAATQTSIVFGASISQQILNSGAFIIWSVLGLTFLGILITALFLVYHRKGLKSKFRVYLKNPLTIFFLLWIGPASLFYLVIYVVKPGYLLNYLPAVIIILSYILNRLSNSDPRSTIVVIRDITREDEGFNWRKAMYYLPGYDVYYLCDQENTGITGQVSSWHGKNHSYNISQAPVLDIPLNSATKIVWIMNDQSSFYQEVKDRLGVSSISLPNGLNIYYSNIGNQTSDFQISNFIFQR